MGSIRTEHGVDVFLAGMAGIAFKFRALQSVVDDARDNGRYSVVAF
jgi:hypothetical protein